MPNGPQLPPGSPIHSAGTRPGRAARRHIGRHIGALYLAGAALVALSLLLPHEVAVEAGLVAIAAGTFCVGVALTAFCMRLPIWASHVATALAGAFISMAVYFSGQADSVYALMLVWPVLLAAYFFPKRQMAAHLAWLLAAYAAALLSVGGHEVQFSPTTRWLLTAMVLGVTGALTSALVARRRESELAHRHLAAIIDHSQDAVVSVTLDGTIASWNDGAERLYGYTAAEAIGQPSSLLVPFDAHGEISAIQARVSAGERVDHYETVRRHRDGHLIDVSLTVSRICDDGGEVVGASAVARDIGARRRLEMDRARLIGQIRALARTDALTEVGNRRAWADELDRELARAERRGTSVAVALLDLDRFKRFNDEHGHVAGDELLRGAARSWRSALRKTDFIARYGGEEFALLLPDCSLEESRETVDRLRESVPMGQTCSAGLATWDGSESATTLTSRADAALYEAKRAGRDRMMVAAAEGAEAAG